MKRERIVLLSSFLMCLAVAISPSWGADGLANSAFAKSARLIGAANTDVSSKVTLCHIRPGNPANAQTISVGQAAVAAHLAHGDSLGECHPACNGVPSAVPKTGLTDCSDADGYPIDCAGTGQDGELQVGVSVSPRFTDKSDGTVKDNLTGLIWLKEASCFDGQDWSAALSSASTLASGTCGLTDGSVAGDWRMPNIKELQSLIDYGHVSPALPGNFPFSGVQLFYYWSSTSLVVPPHQLADAVWVIHLDIGFYTFDYKTSPYPYLWPVRGGQ
jgi:hypothetical protein